MTGHNNLLALIAHNGGADSASLLHLARDRRVQVGASAGTSGALVPRAVINISEQEFSWLEGVGAPEIIPTQLRSEAGAPVLVGSWQTAAMALVDDTPGAEVFLHVGWRRRPAPEDVTRAFAFLEAMNIRENAIV